MLGEQGEQLLDQAQHPGLVLPCQPQDEDPSRRSGRIGGNIRKINVEGHECSALGLADQKAVRSLSPLSA